MILIRSPKVKINMNFEEFVSNDNIIYELSHAVEDETLPHAIIIDGAKGTGKKTLADIIARSCVCLENKGKPCGKCSACVKAIHRSHPDIFIADGNTSGSLSIDAIRNIRSDAYIMPNEAAKKVYILSDCDKILLPAQNALLKILEEPPRNVVFILTVSSANILLQTVRSRSRIYTLYPPSPEKAAEYLLKVFPQRSFEELLNAAKLTDGNIGQIIQNIENGNEETKQLADQIMLAVIGKNEYDLLVLTSQVSKNRDFASGVLDCLVDDAGECIRASAGLDTYLPAAKQIAERFSSKRIYQLADNIEKARNVLKSNVNLNFFGTWLCSVLRV